MRASGIVEMVKDWPEELLRRMRHLGIREDDLVEKFIRGSGHGGQKINKTSSCVYLKHVPTGVEIKCHAKRSRSDNRIIAREELCQTLEEQRERLRRERRNATEKARRRNRPRPPKVKRRIMESKKRRSGLKTLRRKPGNED